MRQSESYTPHKHCVYHGRGHWIFYIGSEAYAIQNTFSLRVPTLDNKNLNSHLKQVDWEKVPSNIQTIILATLQVFIEQAVKIS